VAESRCGWRPTYLVFLEVTTGVLCCSEKITEIPKLGSAQLFRFRSADGISTRAGEEADDRGRLQIGVFHEQPEGILLYFLRGPGVPPKN
jgi:hypothetical protein